MITIETFVPILDLGGTFVFAISGAVAGVNRRLDIFGILVLSFVTGNVGGITRDLLIGAVPPAALTDGRYLLVSVLAGLITFFWYAGVDKLRSPVLLFDAVGLSFFAVAGATCLINYYPDPSGENQHDAGRWKFALEAAGIHENSSQSYILEVMTHLEIIECRVVRQDVLDQTAELGNIPLYLL